MKTLTLLLLATLVVIAPALAEEPFTKVSLEGVANFTMNHVKTSPTGDVELGGIPFDLPKSKRAVETQGRYAPYPAIADIPADVSRPTTVYILLSGGYVLPQFKSKQVGEIVLESNKAEKVAFPIVAWQTIRETWSYNNAVIQPDSRGNPKLINVYEEKQVRGGRPATAFLDMLVIDIERSKFHGSLSKITVNDMSKQKVGNIDPAFIVFAITVKHE